MKNSKAFYRITAFIIAFSCLPLLFLTSSESPRQQIPRQQTHPCISAFNSIALPVTDTPEESIEKNSLRLLSRFHSRTGKEPPGNINYWSGGIMFLLIAACILYSSVSLFHKGNTFSRRFIIKFIHDKDGHKAYSSVDP